MKDNIISRLESIKTEERNFKHDEWKNLLFVVPGKTMPISEVDFKNLSDEDLSRFFEFVILQRSEVTKRKVLEHIKEHL